MIEVDSFNQINEYIREYLNYFDMSDTLHAFNKEAKGKLVSKRIKESWIGTQQPPALVQVMSPSDKKTKSEILL